MKKLLTLRSVELKVLITSIALLAFENASAFRASELYERCKTFSDKEYSSQNSTSEWIDIYSCLSFITGVRNTSQFSRQMHEQLSGIKTRQFDPYSVFGCVPEDVSTGQLAKVYLKYYENNTKSSDQAYLVLMNVMKEYYSCN